LTRESKGHVRANGTWEESQFASTFIDF